ncbi:MAG TPA: UDP-N-acetylenolpyruvoylglucosamine reductase, partial [Pirellulaceae bacterium]
TACLFRDPQGTTASELIEQAGLKGTTVGGAGLCERDLNFVLAAPEATSQDVLGLIETIRDRVSHRTGIDLEPSIQIW